MPFREDAQRDRSRGRAAGRLLRRCDRRHSVEQDHVMGVGIPQHRSSPFVEHVQIQSIRHKQSDTVLQMLPFQTESPQSLLCGGNFAGQSLARRNAAMALKGVKAKIANQAQANRWHQCGAELLFDELSRDHDCRESWRYLLVNGRMACFVKLSASCVKLCRFFGKILPGITDRRNSSVRPRRDNL